MKQFIISFIFIGMAVMAQQPPVTAPIVVASQAFIQPGTPQTVCDQKLEENILFTLDQLKNKGLSPEKLAEARLYMDLLKEKYRLQVEQLIMDRTAFTISGIAARLKAPFITFGDCTDNSSIATIPVGNAISVAERETPCRERLRNEMKQTLLELQAAGYASEIVTLSKYYMEILEQIQLINVKLVSMNRISFPLPEIQGQFQDPFVPYERCKSIGIINPIQ